ncbi:MAG: hypothetical protein JO257_15095 [Deltaproteobacteria bacterium]|nr:hypothetical protein [Deltaproteobacteria bacterium]
MRLVLLSALLLVPAMASADSTTCKTVSAVPADATDAELQLAAKVSLANCTAEANFAQLKLAPDDASMHALTAAAQPSLDMLDDVIRSDDARMAPIAQAARADLLAGMAVRMRDSIAPVTMDTVGEPLAEHDREHAAIEAKIKPWLDQAQSR